MKKAIAFCLCQMANSKLTVYAPPDLADQFPATHGEIQAQMANFGHIPYGQAMVSFLFVKSISKLRLGAFTTISQTLDASKINNSQMISQVIQTAYLLRFTWWTQEIAAM
jgi:hypothetical protein